jgi:preprotein translocase subunit SecE
VAKKKAVKSSSRRQTNAVRRYFNETIGELRKVTWPTRRETTNLTIVVLIVTLAMSGILGILDYIFTQVFALLLS